ncbi:DUF499 domain-containing protein [uncultured Anaerovibrio sp.]|uniref:DUF499 domain-containing protein n=1 Tax=uncultured Anaerovibrio sp. TaxID=361586 RepID=UPI002632F044|nr:DUF499 domain-containing protein [uncultured Anaerovibrio sp.]
MKSLYDLCTPRRDIFDDNLHDDALDLANLKDGSIDVDKFFEETYITEGMHTLIDISFQRFAGIGARGLIRLKQSMGGGKTHNMITLALLAQHPELRKNVPSDIIHGFDKPVRVVSYTGRNNDIKYGLWGEIAEQLGKKEAFNEYYAPLAAPGQNSWIELLKGAPVLIVLDELPPYLSYLRTRQIGSGTEADITVTALANLFNAVNKGGELNNVCIVVSDLNATYETGSGLLEEAMKNLDQELSRTSKDIEPVKATSDDLYMILKKKLFETLPDQSDITEIATGYKEAVNRARQMNYTGVEANSIYTGINEVYPFHPCIKDLFSRFKENNGFQQTRGFIRLTRLMVRYLFENDGAKAKEKDLINAFDFNLYDSTTVSQINNIKSKLTNALSHDIVQEGRGVAEEMDNVSGGCDMQEIAKMILMASLGDVQGVIQGLTANDIIGYMVTPKRDMSNFKELINQFSTRAWYLYSDKNGRLFFKDIQNVNAKMNSIVTSYNNAQAKQEIKKILREKFAPKVKDCYQKVCVFPAIDEISISRDQVTLILFEPNSTGKLPANLQTFFDNENHKNRMMFLSGQHDTMNNLLEVSKEYKAIESIIDELKSENVPETDTQYRAALDLQSTIIIRMRSAMNETFVTLYYPSKENNGSHIRSRQITMNFRENNFDPEEQIRKVLIETGKFATQDKLQEDTFRKKIEARIFTAQKMHWNDLLERAASEPEWNWYVPSGLLDAKNRYVANGVWAEESGMIDKNPPPPKTSLSIREQLMDGDKVVLKLTPINGDTVYWEVEQPATEASSRVPDISAFKTDEIVVYFTCVDSAGNNETGDSLRWENRVKIKYQFFDKDDAKYCTLVATNSKVKIYYSTDGSKPQDGAVYNEPFRIPTGARILQAVAYYEKANIYGDILTQPIPVWEPGAGKQQTVHIDDEKPLILANEFKYSNNKDIYELIVEMKNLKTTAIIENIQVIDDSDQYHYADLSVQKVEFNGELLETQLENLRNNILGAEKTTATLDVSAIKFPSGRDFKRWVSTRKEELNQYSNFIKQ